MNAKLGSEIVKALAEAGRVVGWGSRAADVRRFVLPTGCVLLVVPFRRWAHHSCKAEQARAM